MGVLNRRKFRVVNGVLERLCACGGCGKYIVAGRIGSSGVEIIYVKGHNGKTRIEFSVPLLVLVLDDHICACGKCNILVASDKVYAWGHNPNNRQAKPLPERQLCGCGCGEYANPGYTYINGHGSRNKPFIDDHRNKLSIARIGKEPWNKGMGAPISPPQLCVCGCGEMTTAGHQWVDGHYKQTEEVRQKMSLAKIGLRGEETNRYGTPTSEESLERMRIANKNAARIYWQGLSENEQRAKMLLMAKSQNIRPNKPETFVLHFLNKFYPGEYRYTGDFSFIIKGKSPDFTNCNGQKKVIEFNGSYWHRNDIPGQREDFFAQFGYDTLILTDSDLLDIEKLKIKVDEFHYRVNPYSIHKEINVVK